MSARRLDATALRDWAHTAVGDLISHTDEINRLNVFPVADADTGTNMLFTMRSAWAQADKHAGADDVAAVTAALARGALHRPRGRGPARRCGGHRRRTVRRRAPSCGQPCRHLDGPARAGHHRVGAAGR